MTKPHRVKDPKQLPVQLNVPVPWEYREHLIRVAQDRQISLAQLVRDSLMTVLPYHKG